jgi:hypothetical protein
MHSDKKALLLTLEKIIAKKHYCAILVKTDEENKLWFTSCYPTTLTVSVEDLDKSHVVDQITRTIATQSLRGAWTLIQQAEELTIEQQAQLCFFLRQAETPYQVIFTTQTTQWNNKILLKECVYWHIHSPTASNDKAPSLRSLMLPYFTNLPIKDDRGLLNDLSALIESLIQEGTKLDTETQINSFILMLDQILALLHSPIQGQLLARAIKWSCYRYLKVKQQTQEPC